MIGYCMEAAPNTHLPHLGAIFETRKVLCVETSAAMDRGYKPRAAIQQAIQECVERCVPFYGTPGSNQIQI